MDRCRTPFPTIVEVADEGSPRHSEATFLDVGDEILLAWSAFGSHPAAQEGAGAAGREWRHSRDNNVAEIRIRRSRDDGESWDDSEVLVPNVGGINTMQPSLVALADGRIGLSYSVRDSPVSARRLFTASADGGHSWQAPRDMTGLGGYVTGAHHRLVRHSSGRLLQTCHWLRGDELTVVVAASDDEGRRWSPIAAISMHPDAERRWGHQHGLWEASVCELSDRALLLIARTSVGQVYAARSEDAGSTWSPAAPTGVVAPSAPSVLLSDGDRLVMIHNAGFDPEAMLSGGRSRLSTSTSDDAGRSWRRGQTLFDDSHRWFHYPAVLPRRDSWLLAVSVTDPETRLWDLGIARIRSTTSVIGDDR